jgi:Ca-activated chloride channel family protein
MDLGIAEAVTQLEHRKGEASILLFTDGMPDNKDATLAEAQRAKDAGMRIVAIATGTADTHFLATVTGDPSRVISASTGSFGAAFDQAEESIFGRQLLQSGNAGVYTYREALWRVAGWTAILALSLVLSLVICQTYLLRRRLPAMSRLVALSAAGIGAGLGAGMCGQILFSLLAILGPLENVGRVVVWSVLGALIGLAMAYVIPNMKIHRAYQGGAVGGAFGGMAFIAIAGLIGDVGGRFLGAALIGASIGLLVGLIEALFREAWLTVAFGLHEHRTVSLGQEPVTIGSVLSKVEGLRAGMTIMPEKAIVPEPPSKP